MAELELGAGDVIAALVDYLVADDPIADATDAGDRVFGHELPDSEAQSMPRSCIVVSEAGGFADGLPEVLDRARVDVRAYGATLDQAKRLAVLVRLRMRALGRYVAANGVLLHAASRSGGYIPLRETTGDWPLVLRSYLVPYDERAVA